MWRNLFFGMGVVESEDEVVASEMVAGSAKISGWEQVFGSDRFFALDGVFVSVEILGLGATFGLEGVIGKRIAGVL